MIIKAQVIKENTDKLDLINQKPLDFIIHDQDNP